MRKINLLKIKKSKFKKIKKKISIDNILRILLIFLFSLSTFLLGILYEKILSNRVPTEESEISQNVDSKDLISIQNKVLKKNYVLKIKWGDLGKRMVEDGVIDKAKLAEALTGKENLPKDLDKYFSSDQKQIELTQENSRFWVDVLWGLGLANKNKIPEEGEMMQEGDASVFASTGGWTLGNGDPMSHYSQHSYINLSEKEQKTVEEIAGSIYRPCCGNSTAFPDCNHGMAMLGLIELMVSLGKSPDEIYKTALAFNTYWFPDTYLNVAYYFDKNGRDYSKVSPKEILSETFSSAMGSQTIAKESEGVQWPALQGSGGNCGA